MDEILKEELNRLIARMNAKTEEIKAQYAGYPLESRTDGWQFGYRQGMEFVLSSLIDVMEENENG